MGLFSPGSTIISGLLAGEPDVPEFHTVTAGDSQREAISDNAQNFGAISSLASQYNTFNQQQIESMLRASIPLYDQIKRTTSSDIEAMLRGEVPTSDVASQQLKSVSNAFGLGTTGSSSVGTLVARDLGLSQLDLMQKGLSSAESWITTMGNLETKGMFDMSSMFVTPSQVMSLNTSERDKQFEVDWMQNVLDWQSSIGYLAGSEISQDSAQLDSMVGSVAGSAAGGGGSSM